MSIDRQQICSSSRNGAVPPLMALGMAADRGRWLFIPIGMAINLCLGSVYAYSVFKPAVEKAFVVGPFWGKLPFMVFLFCFSLFVYVGGRLMDHLGPRRLTLLGGLLVSSGWFLAGIVPHIYGVILCYGIVAGAGVGLAYGCPVAMGARWFPDRKGLAVGLMLAGFGGSALVTANVAQALVGEVDALLPAEILARLQFALQSFGVAFAIVVLPLARLFVFPPPGYAPAGFASQAAVAAQRQTTSRQMVRHPAFWGLFVCYTIGCLAGLMAIGISKPVGSDLIRISGVAAARLVGVFAIFNAVGRPLFGWLTDHLGPRRAALSNLLLMLAASVLMLLAQEGSAALYAASFGGFWLSLGGWLAIAPATTAQFFGLRHYAQNYGIVYLAYGLGAILGGIISSAVAHYRLAFYPTAVLAIAGILIAHRWLRPPEHEGGRRRGS